MLGYKIWVEKYEQLVEKSILFRFDFGIHFMLLLSGEFSVRQAQREVVKIKNLNFSYWAWSTPFKDMF